MTGSSHKGYSLVLYESDRLARSFYPLALTRPVCHLLSGTATICEKTAAAVGSAPERVLGHPGVETDGVAPGPTDGAPAWRWGLQRPRGKRSGAGLPFSLENGRLSGNTLFISSGFIPTDDPVRPDFPADRGILLFDSTGDLVGYFLPSHEGRWRTEDLRNPEEGKLRSLTGMDFTRAEIRGSKFSYPWELVNANPGEIADGISRNIPGAGGKNDGEIHPSAVIAGEHEVVICEGAVVGPLSLIDSSGGPVYLARGVSIEAHSVIEGPAFIGEGTRIVRAFVRGGCSIGPRCRVGGEVEQSILHGYVNKYHEGFLGHSYVGSWVNLGAGTTNSDLKNNYGPVRVRVGRTEIDTGLIKVGAFMGDHVKTGIGTLMNTGFICGAGSNIFSRRGVLPKFVPPFVWGDSERMEEYIFRKFEDTARVVMGRRGVEMSERYAGLLRNVFESTSGERKAFLEALEQKGL